MSINYFKFNDKYYKTFKRYDFVKPCRKCIFQKNESCVYTFKINNEMKECLASECEEITKKEYLNLKLLTPENEILIYFKNFKVNNSSTVFNYYQQLMKYVKNKKNGCEEK